MLLSLLCGAPVYAESIEFDEVTKQEITVPLNTATMDDYLVDMAGAANVNFFADATDFARSPVVAYPATPGAIAGVKGEEREHWTPTLLNLMGDFAAQEKLTTLRSAPRTFLFWSEPDPHELLDAQWELTQAADRARFARAVAAETAKGVPPDQIVGGELEDDPLKRALINYLKTEQNWTWDAVKNAQPLHIRVPLNDLPSDLRALVVLGIRQSVVTSRNFEFLRPEFWKRDDLQVAMVSARVWGADHPLAIGIRYFTLDEQGRKYYQEYPLVELKDAEEEAAPAEMPALPLPKVVAGNGLTEAKFDDSALERVYGGISDEIADPLLDADPRLQKDVTLSVKRLPLRALLEQLQAQSGLRLTLGKDAPADKLLTARANKMPLATFLENLSRVYGVTWIKDGDVYQMQGNQRGDLHLKLLQIGEPYLYRYRFYFYNRTDRERKRAAIGRAVIKEVGMKALQAPIEMITEAADTPAGVAFSSLPENLRYGLRRIMEEPREENLSVALYQINALLTRELEKGELELHFVNGVGQPVKYGREDQDVTRELGTNSMGPRFSYSYIVGPPEMLSFYVSSRDGQLVTPIFDILSYSPWQDPQAPQEPVKKPNNRRLPPRIGQ